MKKIIFFTLIILHILSVNAQFTDSSRTLLDKIEIKKANPANAIIKKATQQRKVNSPYHNQSFQTTAYHYVLITSRINNDKDFQQKLSEIKEKQIIDSLSLTKKDTQLLRSSEFFQNHHIYLMESVSQHQFLQPELEDVTVIAQHTAGIKDPLFAVFATQIQNFSLYTHDMFEVMETRYANPLSVAAINKYQFHLDSLSNQKEDTLYCISFRPKEGVHFTSLKGKMEISKLDFGIRSFIISPFDTILNSPFLIKQEYFRTENGTWFPTQISYQIEIPKLPLIEGFDKIYVLSEQTFHNTKVNIPIKRRNISFAEVTVEEGSRPQQLSLLEQYRNRELTTQEINTYNLWDTIGKKANLDKRLFFAKTFASGKIAFGPIDLDLNNVLNFNKIEKARLGLDLSTNRRMSQHIFLGGFFGYGFGDKSWKYGARIGIEFIRAREFKLNLAYSSTLAESGGTTFYDRDYTIFSGEYYRSWLIAHYDRRNSISSQLQSKITRWLTASIQAEYNRFHTLYNYQYGDCYENKSTFCFDQFTTTAALRFGFKESLIDAKDFNFYRVSPYPIITLQYTHGFSGFLKSKFDYNRFDFKLLHRQKYRILGFSDIIIHAGYIDRALPYPLLYAPRAGYATLGFASNEQFAAMRPNEFVNNTYFSIFFRHNFGRMTQNKNFSPRIVLAQNIGWGMLFEAKKHKGVPSQGLEKGYFETGVVVEDLLVIYKLLAFGVGVYYRYGAYSLPKTIDNFAFKLRFRVSVER